MKKIIGLSTVALMLAALVAWSTVAFFRDTEASTDNTFSAGTLDLKLSDSNESDQDGVTASFGGSDLKPGDSVGPSTITLKNVGSLAADHVDIKFERTVTDNPSYDAGDLGPNIADMSTELTVSSLSYAGTNLLETSGGDFVNPDIEAADNAGNNDGTITLNELNGVVVQSLTAPAPRGGTAAFSITVAVAGSASNGIQGDEANVTVTFGLFQDSSQHLT